MDCAIYYDDELIALVEVDGEYHYILSGLDESLKGGPLSDAVCPLTDHLHFSSLQPLSSSPGAQLLRRKDRLKEFIYSMVYPDIPLYRLRVDQIRLLGVDKAGSALGAWILRDHSLRQERLLAARSSPPSPPSSSASPASSAQESTGAEKIVKKRGRKPKNVQSKDQ